jgi:hypothetical protein
MAEPAKEHEPQPKPDAEDGADSDPTKTDHPVGDEQAAENRENDPPG